MGNSHSVPSTVYLAARIGNSARLQLSLSAAQSPEERQHLLEWEDHKGRTPLIVAAQKGHAECVANLLRAGANVHHMSVRSFGGSALHEAVYYKWRSNGIVEMLLRHGANPFVKNRDNRTALDLALIENASRQLYTSWLQTFDRYGFFAEELMVKTQLLGTDLTWVSRWVTVVPLYATSEPGRRNCLRKIMIIYDGYHSRKPLSSIDLSGASAELASDELQLNLGRDQLQPVGVAAHKTANSQWSFSLSATFNTGIASLRRLKLAVNEASLTILEQQQCNSNIVVPSNEAPASGLSTPPSGASDYDREHPGVQSSSVDDGPSQEATTALADDLVTHSVPISVFHGSADDDINGGVCVVCLDKPQTAGFLHGDSVHRCVCDACAFLVHLTDKSTCPICRQKIERVITGLQ